MKELLNADITNEADRVTEQEINLLPSNDSSEDNNTADRSHNDVVNRKQSY